MRLTGLSLLTVIGLAGLAVPYLSGDEIQLIEAWIAARTRIDKAPGSGDYVEVRGHLDPSGKAIAERIRRRQ